MEPHDGGKSRGWRCGNKFVTPALYSHHFLNDPRPEYTHYNYPGTYQVTDFHRCGLEPDDTIVNYDDAIEVWTCQLVGLAEYAFQFILHVCFLIVR